LTTASAVLDWRVCPEKRAKVKPHDTKSGRSPHPPTDGALRLQQKDASQGWLPGIAIAWSRRERFVTERQNLSGMPLLDSFIARS
jgi:hypothetical protein